MSETPRVFVEEDNINYEGNFINLYDKEEIHYLKNVHRLKTGSNVIALDNNNYYFDCKIETILNNQITLFIERTKNIPQFPSIDITLIQGIVKGDKQDYIIQKATELGVNKIVATYTDYTDFKIADKKLIEKKLQRWQKIAKQATKQCKRATIPEVITENNLLDSITNCHYMTPETPVIVCSEKETQQNLKQALKNIKGPLRSIALVIGPEGGWSTEEQNLFRKTNLTRVSLGQNILRAETACITAIGNIIYELELT